MRRETGRKKYMQTVEGMMCGMCEAHIAAVLPGAMDGARVYCSARRNSAAVECDQIMTNEQFHAILDPTGYRLSGIRELEEESPGRRLWQKR